MTPLKDILPLQPGDILHTNEQLFDVKPFIAMVIDYEFFIPKLFPEEEQHHIWTLHQGKKKKIVVHSKMESTFNVIRNSDSHL